MALKLFGNYGNVEKEEGKEHGSLKSEEENPIIEEFRKMEIAASFLKSKKPIDNIMENSQELEEENRKVSESDKLYGNKTDDLSGNTEQIEDRSSNALICKNELIFFKHALSLLNGGKLRESQTFFQHLSEISDRPAAYLFGAAVASAKLMQTEKAVSFLNAVLQMDSIHEGAKSLLSILKGPDTVITTERPPHSKIEEDKPQSEAHEIKDDGLNRIFGILIKARDYLNKGKIKEAFELIIQAKGFHKPVLGLDLLRARCFIEMNQEISALQALKEELRAFPDNKEAKNLLDSFSEIYKEKEEGFETDEDFMGIYNSIKPYTMLSKKRLYSLYKLARKICEENIPGNFVECGVAAGGSTALLAMVIKKYTRMPRLLYAYDSFEGMPEPGIHDKHNGVAANETGWGQGTCAASENSVKNLIASFSLQNIVITIKGYFENTLPMMRDFTGMISLLHMDGDWYSSTKTILENMYERVVRNGAVQIDDYGFWEGCKKAVHDFEKERNLSFLLNPIDYTGVYFKKTDSFPVNPVLPKEIVNDFMADDIGKSGILSQMSENERFQLYYILRNLLPRKTVPVGFLEIGSFSGASLMLTYKAFIRMGVEFKGASVEPFLQPQFKEVLKLTKDHILHFKNYSDKAIEGVRAWLDQTGLSLEFLFIDGDHTFEGVAKDIDMYFPLLTPGGIVVFHDYLPPLDEKNREAILFHHGGKEPGIRKACLNHLETFGQTELLDIPLLYPDDPTQTQAFLPIIPNVYSTLRAYRKK